MKKSLWEQIWEAQGKRCSTCDKVIELAGTAKSAYSFGIVCGDCFSKPMGLDMIILDEFGGLNDTT